MQRFEQIYAEQHGAVRAYVRRRVAEDAVDDIVSETFLVCWRKLDRVPDEALPWLYAVARKTIANHRRKLARQAPPRAAIAGGPEPAGDGASPWPSHWRLPWPCPQPRSPAGWATCSASRTRERPCPQARSSRARTSSTRRSPT